MSFKKKICLIVILVPLIIYTFTILNSNTSADDWFFKSELDDYYRVNNELISTAHSFNLGKF